MNVWRHVARREIFPPQQAHRGLHRKRILFFYVRSRNVVENAGNSDKMADNYPDLLSEIAPISWQSVRIDGLFGAKYLDYAIFRGLGTGLGIPGSGSMRGKCKNEDSSGYIDENKERWISGVWSRAQDSRFEVWGFARGKGKNEGSSGYIDENKEQRISDVRKWASAWGFGTRDIMRGKVQKWRFIRLC